MVNRVALLSLHSSPLARPGTIDVGGMNVYVRRVARELGARGIDVDVYTRRTDPHAAEVVALGSRARLIHLAAGPPRAVPKSVLALHVPAMACAMARFAERDGVRYDVLQSHYWVSGLVGERYRIAVGERPPLVQMFHTLARLKQFYSGHDDPADSALRMDAERRLIRRVDAVVGNTATELRELETLYAQTPRLYRVIPPGVDLDLFRPNDTHTARQELGIDAQKVILFVGRFDRLKGVDILLRSVANLPTETRAGLKLLLLGGEDVPEHPETQRYVRLAASLGIAAQVDFRGRVDQEELPSYYAAADVCAVPSAYESFGMTTIEAMACQTPVVAFRVGGPATTIAHGRTGFLAAPGSIDGYTACLLEALTATDLPAMGRKARFAVRDFTWGNTTSRTVQLFDDMEDAAYRQAGSPISLPV